MSLAVHFNPEDGVVSSFPPLYYMVQQPRKPQLLHLKTCSPNGKETDCNQCIMSLLHITVHIIESFPKNREESHFHQLIPLLRPVVDTIESCPANERGWYFD